MITYVKRFAVFAILIPTLILGLPHVTQLLSHETLGTIEPTGNMNVPRFDHTATLLPNGMVLVAAGLERNGIPVQTAELYDPQSAHFISVGNMKLAHGWGSYAVLLANGKVLIGGGSTGPSATLKEAELYDPSSNSFSLTGSMSKPRDGALAVALRNGDVLVIGGEQTSLARQNTAELYHPSSGEFSITGSMNTNDITTALLLQDGKVLALGASSAEIYDPSTGKFTVTGHLRTPRSKYGAALLPDGKVLVAGGQINGAWGSKVALTEIYNPATGRFAQGPGMILKRFKLKKSLVTLRDGFLLVAGGAEKPEVYNPQTHSFALAGGSNLDGFLFSTATALNNGEVLLVGGYPKPGGAGVEHAWLYHL